MLATRSGVLLITRYLTDVCQIQVMCYPHLRHLPHHLRYSHRRRAPRGHAAEARVRRCGAERGDASCAARARSRPVARRTSLVVASSSCFPSVLVAFQEPRVGPGGYCSPRHRAPLKKGARAEAWILLIHTEASLSHAGARTGRHPT